MTLELHITVGKPASGKTTWAREFALQSGMVRVSRDPLRLMLSGGWTGDPVIEEVVTDMQYAGIHAALAQQRSVVVDDTNLNLSVLKRLIYAGRSHSAKVVIHHFQNTLAECIHRDASRGSTAYVGEKVIRDMDDLEIGMLEERQRLFSKADLYLTPCGVCDRHVGTTPDGMLLSHNGCRGSGVHPDGTFPHVAILDERGNVIGSARA